MRIQDPFWIAWLAKEATIFRTFLLLLWITYKYCDSNIIILISIQYATEINTKCQNSSTNSDLPFSHSLYFTTIACGSQINILLWVYLTNLTSPMLNHLIKSCKYVSRGVARQLACSYYNASLNGGQFRP